MYRILMVEDDSTLAKAMSEQIHGWGNEVWLVTDFQNVIEEFKEYQPHLVLLDIMLPFFNGYHWCQEIRRISKVPVIFLSSASDNMNIVMAINMGGDDFIPKPVDPMVLTAKLQATLRRTYEMQEENGTIEFCGASLNPGSGCLVFNGDTIDLTKNELRILQTLLENKDKIVSRDRLMTRLWQDDCYVEENTLTVNVARLRKKLEQAGLSDVIETKPGIGYMIKG